MFSKKETADAVTYEPSPDRQRAQQMPSIISEGVEIVGDMIGETEIQVDGIVRGNMKAKRVTVGRTGTVDGGIKADTATIAGNVTGDIVAKSLTLEASARIKSGVTVHGDMSMAAGARLDGKVTMKVALETSVSDKPAAVKSNGNAKPNGTVTGDKAAGSAGAMSRPAA